MKILSFIKFCFFLTALMHVSYAIALTRYGEKLCDNPDYFCIKTTHHDSWDELFPDLDIQNIVMRLNRMNVPLKSGMIIAVPKHIDNISIYDISPFPRYIEPTGEKVIYISQKELAWGAYDHDGQLVWWGPISSGVGPCQSKGGCDTPEGFFRVIRKQDESCISTAYPRYIDGETGGAPMPYCMHFFRGYALHGSDVVPGYRASHGCVRLFVEDAQWLNEEFIELPGVGAKGTRVIIEGITG